MNGFRLLWHGGGTAQIGRPKGPAHSIISTPPPGASRVAAGLRFASCPHSAGGRPLTHLDCPELSSRRQSLRPNQRSSSPETIRPSVQCQTRQ
jgi:hypothetical protein